MEKPHISQIETKFADGLFAVERILAEHTCIQKLHLYVYIYGHSSIERIGR